MWKKIAPLLIVLSVALNLAFVGVWAAHAVAARWNRGECPHGFGADADRGIWCPLHRQLGASDAQWRQVEPRLAEFLKSSQEVCGEMARRRAEMIDLLACPQPDRQAIVAKQEEILTGQRRMQTLVIEQLLSEKEILTSQQQKELFDLLRRRSGCAGQGPMMMDLGAAGEASSRPCAGTCPSE